jgi:WD40 repeat protein
MDTLTPTAPVTSAPPAVKPIASLKGHVGGVVAVAFTPDRGTLAVAPRDGAGRMWDLNSSTPRDRGLFGGEARFRSLAYSPNGRYLMTGSAAYDGLVRVYDVEKSPREVLVLRTGRGMVNAVGFSADGKQIAASGDDGTVRLWDLVEARNGPRAELRGHTAAVRALAFASDGQGLATAGDDGSVRLWALSRIRCWERVAYPHPSGVVSVAFAPNRRTLVTGGADGIIRIWDPASLKSVPRAELVNHSGPVRLVHITSDSLTLVSVGDGPRVLNWDLSGTRLIRDWDVPPGAIGALAITSDGRYLAIGRPEGAVDVCRIAEKRA